MATIPPFVAKNAKSGQKQIVKAKKMVWIPVGEGEVKTLSDYAVKIAGKLSILGFNGELNIDLLLTDEDPSAKEGTCILQLNSHRDEAAKYKVKNGALTVYAVLSGVKQNITIMRCNDGLQTECKLFGKYTETVHLEPKRNY